MRSAVQATEAVERAIQREDWDALRALYHPEALIHAAPGTVEPSDADTSVAAVQRYHAGQHYRAVWQHVVELDEHAAVVHGSIRLARGGHGFTETVHCWLVTAEDGLVYRVVEVASQEDGARLYRERGTSAGLPA